MDVEGIAEIDRHRDRGMGVGFGNATLNVAQVGPAALDGVRGGGAIGRDLDDREGQIWAPRLMPPTLHQRAQAIAIARQAGIRFALIPCRSEEHTSELKSLMRISYAVFRLKQKTDK